MNCVNCGTNNDGSSKFCIKCGNPLQTEITSSEVSTNEFINTNQNTVNVEPIQDTLNNDINTINNNENNNSINNNTIANTDTKMNIFSTIFSVLIHPVSTIKNNKNKLENTKNSVLLWLFVTIGATLLNLISTLCNLVIRKDYDDKIRFVWDYLEDFKYFEVILKSFLLFGIGIFLVAIIYFVIGAIYKKDSKLPSLIGVTSLSFVPLVLCCFLIAPIMNYIYMEISLFISIIGIIYTLLILSINMNDELKLENNDNKVFLNLIAIAIIIVGSYFSYTRILLGMSSDYDDFSDIFDMFDY